MLLDTFDHKLDEEFALRIIEWNRPNRYYSREGTLIMPTADGFVQERCTVLGGASPYLTIIVWKPKNFTIDAFNEYEPGAKIVMTADPETGAILRHNETSYELKNLRQKFGKEHDLARPFVRFN